MLKLNGGLGTSMGLEKAKSLLEVRGKQGPGPASFIPGGIASGALHPAEGLRPVQCWAPMEAGTTASATWTLPSPCAHTCQVKDGKTFLDLIAEQVKYMRTKYSCNVPFILMNR